MPHTTTKNQRTKRVDTRPNEVTDILIISYYCLDDQYHFFLILVCRKYDEC